MQPRLATALLLTLFFIAAPTLAQDADTLFRSGIAAFRSGDYATARIHFERALAAGVDRPALHYNLGATYYRLGELAKAEASFRKLASIRGWEPIAYYNIALVARKAGQEDKSRLWLERARDTGDKTIAPLAEQLLNPSKAVQPQPKKLWSASLNLSAGQDDNLVDPAALTTTAEGDSFAELFATFSRILSGSHTDGLRFDVNGYLARYAEFDAYDMNLLRGEFTYALPIGAWLTEATVRFDQSSLGGEDYLRQSGLGFSGRRPFSATSGIRLAYRLNRIEALSDVYEPQEGWQQQAVAEGHWDWGGRRARIRYTFETNDREDLLDGEVFTSYSPDRHQLEFGIRQRLGPKWEWAADAGMRNSRYADPNRLIDGTTTVREDQRNRIALSLSRRFDSWEIRGDYAYIDNDSNLDSYDYDQNLYTLSLSRVF